VDRFNEHCFSSYQFPICQCEIPFVSGGPRGCEQKIRRIAGGFRSLGDVAATSEIGQGDVRIDLTTFVEKLIEVPLRAASSRAACRRPRFARVHESSSCSSVSKRCTIADGRRADQLLEVVDKQRSRLRGGYADSIQIYLLAAVVGSQSDEIALVGNDVVKLVLVEEARSAE